MVEIEILKSDKIKQAIVYPEDFTESARKILEEEGFIDENSEVFGVAYIYNATDED